MGGGRKKEGLRGGGEGGGRVSGGGRALGCEKKGEVG